MLNWLLLLPLSLFAGDMGESFHFAGNIGLRVDTQQAEEAGLVIFESALSEPNYTRFDAVIFNGEFLAGNLGDLERVQFEFVLPGPDGGEELVFPAPGQRRKGAVNVAEDGRFWGTVIFPGAVSGVPVKLRLVSSGSVRPMVLGFFDLEAFSTSDSEGSGSSAIRFKQDKNRPPVRKENAIYARSQWQPQGFTPRQAYEEHKVQRLTFHHSAGRHVGGRDAQAELNAIFSMHTNPPEKGGRGWNDIAYHYFVDKDGNMYAGRPEHVVGAHAGSAALNRGNIGICLLGNFHPPKNDKTPDFQGNALTWLMDSLIAKYKLGFESAEAHRDLKSTECPGDFAYRAFSFAKPAGWKPRK